MPHVSRSTVPRRLTVLTGQQRAKIAVDANVGSGQRGVPESERKTAS